LRAQIFVSFLDPTFYTPTPLIIILSKTKWIDFEGVLLTARNTKEKLLCTTVSSRGIVLMQLFTSSPVTVTNCWQFSSSVCIMCSPFLVSQAWCFNINNIQSIIMNSCHNMCIYLKIICHWWKWNRVSIIMSYDYIALWIL